MTTKSHEDTEQLSPEQINLKIAELQKEKSATDLELSQAEARRVQEQQNIQETNAEITLKTAVAATGISWHPDSQELKAIMKSRGYLFTASTRGDSIRVLTPDGKQLSLESALERLATELPFLADSDTTKHLQPRNDQGEFAEVCRDDFKTIAAKSRFISEHPGVWETMPQKRMPTVPVSQLTARQYSALSLSAKAKLVAEIGLAQLEAILRRR